MSDVEGLNLGGWTVAAKEIDDITLDSSQQRQIEAAEYPKEINSMLTAFQQTFGVPTRVFHPACGAYSIEPIFPETTEVVHLDIDQKSIEALTRHGVSNAVCMSAEHYQPNKQFDLVISLNSHAPMEEQVKDLMVGGHVICNNYLGTRDAEKVFALRSNYQLVGVVLDSLDDISLNIIKTDLAKYLELESLPADHNLRELGITEIRTHPAAYYIFQRNS